MPVSRWAVSISAQRIVLAVKPAATEAKVKYRKPPTVGGFGGIPPSQPRIVLDQ